MGVDRARDPSRMDGRTSQGEREGANSSDMEEAALERQQGSMMSPGEPGGTVVQKEQCVL